MSIKVLGKPNVVQREINERARGKEEVMKTHFLVERRLLFWTLRVLYNFPKTLRCFCSEGDEMGRNDRLPHFIIFFTLLGLHVFGRENWTSILALFLLFTEPVTFLLCDG